MSVCARLTRFLQPEHVSEITALIGVRAQNRLHCHCTGHSACARPASVCSCKIPKYENTVPEEKQIHECSIKTDDFTGWMCCMR